MIKVALQCTNNTAELLTFEMYAGNAEAATVALATLCSGTVAS